MKRGPLQPHAIEMLRLIASRSSLGGRYWTPQDKHEFVEDAFGPTHVFVSAPWSTGAIRTLTSRGLVEVVPGAMDRWARRLTVAGRAHLDQLVDDIEIQLRYAREHAAEEMIADGW
ncbi:MAG TPA: hypothetical protein VGD81_03245 [Opitutaceae bacterium]